MSCLLLTLSLGFYFSKFSKFKNYLILVFKRLFDMQLALVLFVFYLLLLMEYSKI